MVLSRRELIKAGILLGSTLVLGCAGKKEEWPTESVTIIVPYKPGGGFDTYARGVEPFLEKYLGVPVAIVNEPAGGGKGHLSKLYKMTPDGYTIGMLNLPGFAMYQIVEEVDFDLRKLTYIAQISSDTRLIEVSSTSTIQTWEDLVKEAGKRTLLAGGGSIGSTNHLFTIMMRETWGLNVKYIPYKGSSGARVALLRGEIDFVPDVVTSALPLIKDGKIRPLLVVTGSKKRHPDLPDTPTDQEKGLEDISAGGTLSRGFIAPPNLPDSITKKWIDAFRRSLEDPEMVEWSKTSNRPLDPLYGEEYRQRALKALDKLEPLKQVLKKALAE
jgi:tripartite-type tricarboxylate transporter receptor subunit TctC